MSLSNVGVGSRNLSSELIEVVSGNFAYNQPQAVETSQRNRLDGYVKPVGGHNEFGPYEFDLPPLGDSYLNLKALDLYVKAKVRLTKADGDLANIPAGKNVVPLNMFGTMFVQHAEIRLNDNMLTPSSANDVNIKRYVENLLSYQEDACTHLQAQIFAMDTPGKMDGTPGANEGAKKRAAFVAESKSFQFTAPIAADFLGSHNHLGPGNKLSIKLYRAKDVFLFLTDCDAATEGVPTLLIEDMRLYYSRIEASIARPLKEVHVIAHTELSKFPLAANKTNFTLQVVTGGVLPRTLIVFFINTAAYNGTYTSSPLDFEHLKISYMALRVNGKTVPADGLNPDFTANDYPNTMVAREYLALFNNTGTNRINRGNLITLERWCQGYTLFCFDLSPDYCNGYHLHEAQVGVLEVDVRCSGMTAATQAMCYACYDMEATIYPDGRHDMAYFVPGSGGGGSGGGGGGGGSGGGGGRRRKNLEVVDEEEDDE